MSSAELKEDQLIKWLWTFIGTGVDIGLTDDEMVAALTPEKIRLVAEIARASKPKGGQNHG